MYLRLTLFSRAMGVLASLLILCGGFAGVLAQDSEVTYARYSPCAPSEPVNKGAEFVVGLALWPGGTVNDWGPATNDTQGVPGLNPCLGEISVNAEFVNYQQYLDERNVYFSTYATQVDTMAALRTTKQEEDQLFQLATSTAGKQPVLSVIAFRGNVRSEAHYIRSDSTTLTGGTGVVERLGLLVTLDQGLLTRLEWYDFDKCTSCGGSSSSRCIKTQKDASTQLNPQESCGFSLEDQACKCRGIDCRDGNCTTTILVGFRGNTQSGQPLQTAYQMTAAFQYSISAAFTNFFDQIGRDLADINTGTVGGGFGGGGGVSRSPSPSPTAEPAPAAPTQTEQPTETQPPPVQPEPVPQPVPVLPEPLPPPVQPAPGAQTPAETAVPTDPAPFDPAADANSQDTGIPAAVPGDPAAVPGDPAAVPADPAGVPGDPAAVPGDPAAVPQDSALG